MTHASAQDKPAAPAKTETAVFGMGCFWCAEALFERFKGVQTAVCGYAGGPKPDPTYEEVCTGETGHAEVVQVTFDPAQITYAQLLEAFFETHDPTTLNQQGPDHGTQYRSAIFYQGEEQRRQAEEAKKAVQTRFSDPVTTEIAPLKAFYPAEAYHQHYFREHPNVPYCLFIISPKLQKLEKHPPAPLQK